MARASTKDALKVIGAARRQLRAAQRRLAQIEEGMKDDDRFGTYTLGPGEPIDERDLMAYLQRARREHPTQVVQITVIALGDEDESSGGPDERNRNGGRAEASRNGDGDTAAGGQRGIGDRTGGRAEPVQGR